MTLHILSQGLDQQLVEADATPRRDGVGALQYVSGEPLSEIFYRGRLGCGLAFPNLIPQRRVAARTNRSASLLSREPAPRAAQTQGALAVNDGHPHSFQHFCIDQQIMID